MKDSGRSGGRSEASSEASEPLDAEALRFIDDSCGPFQFELEDEAEDEHDEVDLYSMGILPFLTRDALDELDG